MLQNDRKWLEVYFNGVVNGAPKCIELDNDD